MPKYRGGDIQFFQMLPPLKPGMLLRISFWIRGAV